MDAMWKKGVKEAQRWRRNLFFSSGCKQNTCICSGSGGFWIWPTNKRVSNFFKIPECHIILLSLICSLHKTSDKKKRKYIKKILSKSGKADTMEETRTPIYSQQLSDLSTLTGKLIKCSDNISGESHKGFVLTLNYSLTIDRTMNMGVGASLAGTQNHCLGSL